MHTIHSWRVSKFHIYNSRMPCYVTWDTFFLLQASVPRWFGKHAAVGSLEISGSRKQWKYYRIISIGQTFDMISGSTSSLALPVSLPNWPSRSKDSILHGVLRPKRCFCGKYGAIWEFHWFFTPRSYIPWIDICNKVLRVSKRDHMQKLSPREVDVPIYPNRVHSFGFSSPRVRYLYVYAFQLFLNNK